MWDLIVSVPDHCLSFLLYMRFTISCKTNIYRTCKDIPGICPTHFCEKTICVGLTVFGLGPGVSFALKLAVVVPCGGR